MTEQQLALQQQLLLLGEIKGIVQGLRDGQVATNERLDKIDERFEGFDRRLRHVEQRAAVFGAASGGAMAIGTALIIEGIKVWLGRGGNP